MGNVSQSIDVSLLADLQLKALWVLDKHSDVAPRLSASQIAAHLVEEWGTSTSRQAVTYALEKDRGLVHKNADGYKLMEKGREKLASTNTESVIFIEAGKPFSAKKMVAKSIFDSLKSPILVCDPYIDIHTLDLLFKSIDKAKQVHVLTQSIKDKPTGTFARHLQELRQEGFQIEIRVYAQSDLHDRYIMDNNSFWLSGNSLNHIGNKESFIVKLGEDIRQTMQATFDRRWKISTKI